MKQPPYILLAFLCLAFFQSHGQTSGVHGVIADERGSPLSYATIFVKQLGTGTTANEEGFYEIFLPAGKYEMVFQHLGRKSEVRLATVENGFTELNITLVPQEIMSEIYAKFKGWEVKQVNYRAYGYGENINTERYVFKLQKGAKKNKVYKDS